MSETRMPTQKRSIEKRNKIIEKGFILMCNQGYYNTNTSQIAEYAGVSTGIVYQYFNDKKEIFIEGIKNYSNSIMFPIFNIKIDINNKDELKHNFKDLINNFINNHTLSKKAHEELLAMSHLDEDISKIYHDNEVSMTNNIALYFEKNIDGLENPKEKAHIILGIVENLCHEIVYHKHESLNYDIMTDTVIDSIINILTK